MTTRPAGEKSTLCVVHATRRVPGMVNIPPATQMMHTTPIFTPHSLSVLTNQMRILVVDGVGRCLPQGLLPLVRTLQRIEQQTGKYAIAAASTIPTYTTRRTRAPSPGASSVLSRPTVTAPISRRRTGTRPAASTFPVSAPRSLYCEETHKSPRRF